MTLSGGNSCVNDSDGCGVAFKLIPDAAASAYSVVYAFCSLSDCTDGANPLRGLLMDSAGNLFGATIEGGAKDSLGDDYGGGTVFQLGETEQVIHSFCQKTNCVDGLLPSGGLAMDSRGNFFGTTRAGGKFGQGVV